MPAKEVFVSVPLSEMLEIRSNLRTKATKSTYAVNSLRLLLALQRSSIYVDAEPFMINDELYEPPMYKPSRETSFNCTVPTPLHKEAELHLDMVSPTLAQHIARAIELRHDIQGFNGSGNFTASRDAARLEVVRMIPQRSY